MFDYGSSNPYDNATGNALYGENMLARTTPTYKGGVSLASMMLGALDH